MKPLVAIALVISLGACSNTMHGAVDDLASNSHKVIKWTGDAAVKVVDWTGNVVTTVGEDAAKVGQNIGKNASTPKIPDVGNGK